MARPLSTVADDLTAQSRGLNDYLGRAERLFAERRLPRVDLHRAYAGAFLSFYVDLETSIESVFMGLLMGRLRHSRTKVRPLLKISSENVARNVVRGGRPYVNWLPYDATKQRAKVFLASGEPFASVTADQAQAFERARIMRNALAHASSHAAKQFRRTFTENLALPPVQRKPAGYLRGKHTLGQTRFEYLLAECMISIRTLCK